MPMNKANTQQIMDSTVSAQDSPQEQTVSEVIDKYTINGVKPLNSTELEHSLKTTELNDTDNTDNQHYLWKPGQSGNPNGRPKGVRNAISERFLLDLSTVWNKATKDGSTTGLDVIQRVADTEPGKLLAAMVQVLPKDFQVNVTQDQQRWVINAQPVSTSEWLEQHSLTQPIDSKEE